MIRKDLSGHRQGKLVATKTYRVDGKTMVDCICDCGSKRTMLAQVFQRFSTKSCGCEIKASNLVNSPTYHSWVGMKQRCLNASHDAYENYGGRGISVCDRWMKFENFFEDMGEKPNGLEIDRIDTNGDYEPNNCRWTDRITNIRNRRNTRWLTHGGKTMTLSEWARYLNVPRERISRRLDRGWSVEDALMKGNRNDVS